MLRVVETIRSRRSPSLFLNKTALAEWRRPRAQGGWYFSLLLGNQLEHRTTSTFAHAWNLHPWNGVPTKQWLKGRISMHLRIEAHLTLLNTWFFSQMATRTQLLRSLKKMPPTSPQGDTVIGLDWFFGNRFCIFLGASEKLFLREWPKVCRLVIHCSGIWTPIAVEVDIVDHNLAIWPNWAVVQGIQWPISLGNGISRIEFANKKNSGRLDVLNRPPRLRWTLDVFLDFFLGFQVSAEKETGVTTAPFYGDRTLTTSILTDPPKWNVIYINQEGKDPNLPWLYNFV